MREMSGIADGGANARGGANVNTSTIYSTNICTVRLRGEGRRDGYGSLTLS